jgi:hypothetical protein
MRVRNMPVVRHIRNARVRAGLWREETPEEIAAAQKAIDDYWEEVEPQGHVTLYLQPGQRSRDEDEAYARNYAMDQQTAERALEVDENDRYLRWLDDEGWGQERGNPPDSWMRDHQIERASETYPEPEDKEGVTRVPRGPGGSWEFEEWADGHGFSEWDIEQAKMLEYEREQRLTEREGQQMVDEIQRIADDPQYADVRDQIEDISGYVRRVMELGDEEPGELWASGEI